MSFEKTTPKFPLQTRHYSNAELAQIFAKALKEEYGQQASPVKIIARQTGASIATIRKWYSGEKQPSLKYIIILAQNSKNVLRAFLEIVGKRDLWELFQKNLLAAGKQHGQEIYSAKFCTIKIILPYEVIVQLNQRQLWYLGLLQQGHKIKAVDIASNWKISIRSAKYDIKGLVRLKLIWFVGGRKNGYYKPYYD